MIFVLFSLFSFPHVFLAFSPEVFRDHAYPRCNCISMAIEEGTLKEGLLSSHIWRGFKHRQKNGTKHRFQLFGRSHVIPCWEHSATIFQTGVLVGQHSKKRKEELSFFSLACGFRMLWTRWVIHGNICGHPRGTLCFRLQPLLAFCENEKVALGLFHFLVKQGFVHFVLYEPTSAFTKMTQRKHFERIFSAQGES